jgi:hypothetical protein
MFRVARWLSCALVAVCVLTFGASALAQTPPAAPAQEKPAGDLPSAQSIIDRHVAATGGAAAIKQRKSSHATGTISAPSMGLTGTVEIFAMRPNKMLVKQSIAGIGEAAEGFDGTHAWSKSAVTGPMLVTGPELEQKKLDYDFEAALDPGKRYSSMKTLEKTTFDGREVYKLSLTRKEGGEDIDFYDVKTGLKAGSINTRKGPMGEMTVTSTITDYKKFGDVLVPTTIKQALPGMEMVVTFSKFEFDTVAPSVFELPAEIKALIK